MSVSTAAHFSGHGRVKANRTFGRLLIKVRNFVWPDFQRNLKILFSRILTLSCPNNRTASINFQGTGISESTPNGASSSSESDRTKNWAVDCKNSSLLRNVRFPEFFEYRGLRLLEWGWKFLDRFLFFIGFFFFKNYPHSSCSELSAELKNDPG